MTVREESKRVEKKQVSLQELVETLRSVADDIGQISELTSEEKLLVGQFFASLLKLMQPLAPAIPVSVSALPFDADRVAQANVDPTGHIALMFKDGHMELKNLEDPANRDLMVSVIEDIMPKFKGLTSAQKRKVEGRIKFLTAVTKEVQRISEAMSSAVPSS